MLTMRGWWFLLAMSALLAGGLASGVRVLTLTALSLLVWFLAQWLWFALRVRWSRTGWAVQRTLRDERCALSTLWARQHTAVELSLTCDVRWPLPYVLAIDRVPPLAQVQDGAFHASGAVGRGQALQFRYRIVCPAPGLLLFWGLKVQLADLHGFFTASLFVRDVRRCRVLPALADARGRLQAVK